MNETTEPVELAVADDREVVVRLRGVSKRYQEGGLARRTVTVLEDVNLDLRAGGSLAVVGPSGSGKSTLLNLIGTLDEPDAGEITVCGHDLERLDEEALANLRNRSIGFVFQFHQLLPDFTVLENVEMPGRIGGEELGAVRERARGLLVEVGLEDRTDFFPSELSGGERQRVALCRALVNDPELVLADEPTGNLDAESGAAVLDLLIGLRSARGMSLVVVTHDLEVAGRCERVVSLDDGRLQSTERPPA